MPILGHFLWFSYFLEDYGNEDSYDTFPKFLGCTRKYPDFCEGRGTEVRPIAESLPYPLTKSDLYFGLRLVDLAYASFQLYL